MGSPPQPQVGRPSGYRDVIRVALPLNAGAGSGRAPIGDGPIPQPLELLETAPDWSNTSATGPSLNEPLQKFLRPSTDPLQHGSVTDAPPIVPSNSPARSGGHVLVLHPTLFIVLPRHLALRGHQNLDVRQPAGGGE